tara:strand:+ start:82 stop:309 length:228 start_codon:yes stop_codon:yes gene_type:complete
MNRDKHIWEGWTVNDFIESVEPFFKSQMDGGLWGLNHCGGFKDKKHLKKFIKENQPYYKKHIPEVYNYFLNKSGL